jgi:hypothetical protein
VSPKTSATARASPDRFASPWHDACFDRAKVRLTSFVAAATLALATVPAHAQTELPPAPAPTETFAYTTPAEPNPLRAVLEIGAVFTLGFTWYATTAPTVNRWDVGYRWQTFRRKITFDHLGPDANSFGTNFIGHPLGGTGYYLAARSNRLSILQSFGMSVAGSLFWELLGEVSEVVSMNDMIVTPLAGLAIGEATTQLGAALDRCQANAANRIAAATLGPFKTMNDAFDSLEPARAAAGCPNDDWRRFRAEAAATLARQDAVGAKGRWWPEARFEISSRLARLPGFDASGRDTLWFDDGNVSDIELTLTAGARGVTELDLVTDVVLAGLYYRARRLDWSGASKGSNGYVGVTSGFEYALHQYRRGEGRAIDRWAAVRPLGVRFEQRGALGGPMLNTLVELGPDFGGVTPVAIGEYRGRAGALPVVQAARGYYFGIGGHLGTSIELEDGPLVVRGELRAAHLRDVRGRHDPKGASLDDWFVGYGGSVSYRSPRSGVGPRVFVERRLRFGRVGAASSRAGELGFGTGLGATF